MSEWLGKPRLSKKDIEEYQPTMVKSLPSLAEYFVEDQKFRLTVIFPYETFDKFKEAVVEEYGEFTAEKSRKAVEEAVGKWIEDKTRRKK